MSGIATVTKGGWVLRTVNSLTTNLYSSISFYIYFTFMHLADAFIQSDLHCIQVTVFYILSALAFPMNRTHDIGVASAMLYHLSYRKASVVAFLQAEAGAQAVAVGQDGGS